MISPARAAPRALCTQAMHVTAHQPDHLCSHLHHASKTVCTQPADTCLAGDAQPLDQCALPAWPAGQLERSGHHHRHCRVNTDTRRGERPCRPAARCQAAQPPAEPLTKRQRIPPTPLLQPAATSSLAPLPGRHPHSPQLILACATTHLLPHAAQRVWCAVQQVEQGRGLNSSKGSASAEPSGAEHVCVHLTERHSTTRLGCWAELLGWLEPVGTAPATGGPRLGRLGGR